jgi:hypothetical protein
MMMAEDHIGDLVRADAKPFERTEDIRAAGDHAWIHDNDGAAIADKHDGTGHPLGGITSAQDIQEGAHVPILSPRLPR